MKTIFTDREIYPIQRDISEQQKIKDFLEAKNQEVREVIQTDKCTEVNYDIMLYDLHIDKLSF
jgi:hypothetical protein